MGLHLDLTVKLKTQHDLERDTLILIHTTHSQKVPERQPSMAQRKTHECGRQLKANIKAPSVYPPTPSPPLADSHTYTLTHY